MIKQRIRPPPYGHGDNFGAVPGTRPISIWISPSNLSTLPHVPRRQASPFDRGYPNPQPSSWNFTIFLAHLHSPVQTQTVSRPTRFLRFVPNPVIQDHVLSLDEASSGRSKIGPLLGGGSCGAGSGLALRLRGSCHLPPSSGKVYSPLELV